MKLNRQKLAYAMFKSGVGTFREVCKLSKLNPNTVSAIANGKSCRMMTVIKLAEALHADPTELLEEEE